MALTITMEDEVGYPDGVAGDIFSSEFGGHRVLLPQSPVLVLHMHRKHWRMVTYLREEGVVNQSTYTYR